MRTSNPSEISSPVASARVSRQTENYCLARAKRQCAFSGPCVGKRMESLRALPLLPFAQLEGSVLLQGLSWNLTPTLPLIAKSGQLCVSAFSWDFLFISLVEFHGAQAAWTLSKSKSWFDPKNARKFSLKVNTSFLTYIFVPFFANSLPTVPSPLLLHTHTHTHTHTHKINMLRTVFALTSHFLALVPVF